MPLASPSSDEGRLVAVVLVYRDAVVAVPCVKYGLAFYVRYASRLVERGLRVVGFEERMFVQGLEVDGASRLAVLFRADYHAVTPC